MKTGTNLLRLDGLRQSSSYRSDVEKQQSVADPRLDFHDPIELVVNRSRTFSVKVRTPTEALMICRVLLSKIVVRRDLSILSTAEQYILSEAWNVLRMRKSRSLVLAKSSLVASLLYVENCRRMTLNPNVDHSSWWTMLSRKEGILSPHAYFGWFGSNNITQYLRFRNRETERPKTANKRFVGVGYRDKGNTRDVAFDASPTWQEVAGVHLPFKEIPLFQQSFLTALGG